MQICTVWARLPESSKVTDAQVQTKRIYDEPEDGDGYRVLVDRIWPRGVSKEDARLDEWARDIAPSNDLRTWFDHREDRWEAFRARYRRELGCHHEKLKELRAIAEEQKLTLLFGAKDERHNQAVVIREYLEALPGRP